MEKYIFLCMYVLDWAAQNRLAVSISPLLVDIESGRLPKITYVRYTKNIKPYMKPFMGRTRQGPNRPKHGGISLPLSGRMLSIEFLLELLLLDQCEVPTPTTATTPPRRSPRSRRRVGRVLFRDPFSPN